MRQITFSLGLALVAATATVFAGSKPKFDERGNVLIVDRYNNRIIELDPLTRTNIWQYEVSVSKAATNWLVGPLDAERFKGRTLIVAGELPAGVSTNYPDGYSASRVFEVNRKGKILWEYGDTSLFRDGDHDLNGPVSAVYGAHKCVLIADQGNHRVIHVRRRGGKNVEIVWQYGTTGVSGVASNQLNSPSSIQHLGSGNYLIADTGNNRVIEVKKRTKEVVWQYGTPADTTILNSPTYACRLKHDNILITDSGNNRILIVDPNGSNLFTYVTSAQYGSVTNPTPLHAVLLKSGNILIADQFNHQVIQVDAGGNVVFTHGVMGVAGNTDGLLNAPVDAKIVEDFTSLTAPKGEGDGGSGFGFPF